MDQFSNRLLYILEKYSMNASAFAERIGVQRSSLSHLLSGRNKPSLDLIIRIHDTFPELNLEWLIYGKEPIKINSVSNSLYNEKDSNSKPLQSEQHLKNEFETSEEQHSFSTTTIDQNIETSLNFESTNEAENLNSKTSNEELVKTLAFSHKEIEQIVIFYTDGTFKNYKQN